MKRTSKRTGKTASPDPTTHTPPSTPRPASRDDFEEGRPRRVFHDADSAFESAFDDGADMPLLDEHATPPEEGEDGHAPTTPWGCTSGRWARSPCWTAPRNWPWPAGSSGGASGSA